MNKVTLYRWGGEGNAWEVYFYGISTAMEDSLHFMQILFESYGEMETLITTNKEKLLLSGAEPGWQWENPADPAERWETNPESPGLLSEEKEEKWLFSPQNSPLMKGTNRSAVIFNSYFSRLCMHCPGRLASLVGGGGAVWGGPSYAPSYAHTHTFFFFIFALYWFTVLYWLLPRAPVSDQNRSDA